ncbi:MAG TPA: tripartite tricarboxylate transporter TctB family protein [Afifellaceae bacterium]|nr:tripartite tricarboxylate transporter TctB family protein [Afifellaceae bacterium]
MIWINRIVPVLMIFAVFPLWRISDRFPESAATFPRVILVAIACLAVILLSRTFIPAIAAVAEGEGGRSLSVIVRPVAVALIAIATVGAMRLTGFIPAMMAMAAVLMFVLQVEKRKFYVIAFALLLVFIFVVFGWALGVPLTKATLFS